MGRLKILTRLIIATAIVLAPFTVNAAAGADTVRHAAVSFLKGTAETVDADGKAKNTLRKGDRLTAGDRLRTGRQSRLEIRLPDDSFLRFGEETTFQLTEAMLDSKRMQRDIGVRVTAGKVWAKVSRIFSGRGRFAISTKTAVAGVRGTTYRMNVNADNSAVVKVYEGEVEVKRRVENNAIAAYQNLNDLKPVSGPRPIAGPRPVTMEQWVHLVRSLQQIDIRPDGSATKPFRFDIAADENDWVRWNRKRDEEAVGSLGEALRE
jgi:hypothetical protein